MPSLPGPQDTVSESVAAEWAACFGVELEEIWGDAVHREEPDTDAPTQAAPVGGEPSPQPVLSLVLGEQPPLVPVPDDPWAADQSVRAPAWAVDPDGVMRPIVPVELDDPTPDDLTPSGWAEPVSSTVTMVDPYEVVPGIAPVRRRAIACPQCRITNGQPSAPVPIVPAAESGHAKTGHVGRVPVPERKRKMTAGMVPCPICQVPQLVLKGLRNHIRNAHHRDPDEMLGVPTYRQIKPIGDPVPAVVPPSDPSDVLSIGEWCEAHPRPKAPDADVDMRSPERRYLDLLLSWAERDGPNTDLLDRIEAMLAKVGTLAP